MTSNVEEAMRRIGAIRAVTKMKIAISRQLCEKSRDLVRRNADIRKYVHEYVLASPMDRESQPEK